MRLALRGIALVLVFAMGAVLVCAYVTPSGPGQSLNPSRSATTLTSESAAGWCILPSKYRLRLVVQSIDTERGLAQISPSFCAEEGDIARIREWSTGKPIMRTTPYGPRFDKKFRNSDVTVQLKPIYPNANHTLRIPLRDLENVLVTKVLHLRTVNMLLQGDETDYPRDNFDVSGIVEMFLPPGTFIRDSNGERKRTVEWPGKFYFARSQAMGGMDVQIAHPRGGWFEIYIERSRATGIFVVGVLLVPILLFFGLWLLGYLNRRQPPTELFIGAAAVIVALLPIREVLVPPKTSGLTLVDYALGFELTLLAALAIWQATGSERGSRSTEFKPAHDRSGNRSATPTQMRRQSKR